MTKLALRTVLLPAALVLALAACGGSDSDTQQADDTTPAADSDAGADAPATDAASGTDVNIKNSRFDPTELEVAVGDTVTFTNSDAFAHTVTSKDDQAIEFASGEFADGATFELTLDEAGTFAYFCEIHPTMRATIVVS